MFKTMFRAALPLLAATAIAQAADQGSAGKVTFVDHASGRVLLNNSEFVAPSSLAGIAVGGVLAPSKPQKAGMAMALEQKAAGPVSFIDAAGHRIVVANVLLTMPAAFDMSGLRVGTSAEVSYKSIEGMNSAIQIAWSGRPTISLAQNKPAGRVTYIDALGGKVLVNNAWMHVPAAIDIRVLRVGDSIPGSFTEASKAAGTAVRG